MFRTADLCIGGILSTISVLGSITNIFSLSYFRTGSAHNNNNIFFKRLYVLICSVDFTICLTLFPMIEAAFLPQRRGQMFGTPWFCESWGILWTYLPILSIFLLAVLSVSRLLLLMLPTLRLDPALAWWLPGVYSAGVLTLILSLFLSQTLSMVYRPEWLSCSPSVFHQDTNSTDLVQPGDVRRGILITIIFSSLPGLSIIPIAVAAVLSLIYLRRSAIIAGNNLNSSAHQQHNATLSVITVTSLYVVLNVPFSLTVFGGIILNISLSRDSATEVTVHVYNTASLTDNPGINNYCYFVVFYLCICLNSFLNPFMYFWRMSGYRKYVSNVVGRKSRAEENAAVLALRNVNRVVSPSMGLSASPTTSVTYNSVNVGKQLPRIDE